MARNVTTKSSYHASSAQSPAVPAPVTASAPAGPAAMPLEPGVVPVVPVVPAKPKTKAKTRPAGSASREYAHCDLCGEPLGSHTGHFHMVSPLTARHVSVWRTCRRAALGEGYRPRA